MPTHLRESWFALGQWKVAPDFRATAHGTVGDDSLVGGPGADTLNGLGGEDTLSGLGGADKLIGGDGDDRLDGGAGNDLLLGVGGSNSLLGGGGDDRLVVGDGDNILNGGGGFDVVSFAGQTADLLIRLQDDFVVAVGSSSDTLIGIEGVIGNAGDDTISGGDAPNSVVGGHGADSISTANGADTVSGGEGDDHIKLGDGDDRVLGGSGNDTLDAGFGSSTMYGGIGDDNLSSDGGGEYFGGAGDDRMTMITTQKTATLHGGAGDDSLYGFNMTAFGGKGADYLGGGRMLFGGSGDDTLECFGAGYLNGGTGLDTVMFEQGVTADLRIHGPQDSGHGTITLVGVENLTGLGDTSDRFTGDRHRNVLNGRSGADTLMGLGGADILIGDSYRPGSPGALLIGGGGDDKLTAGRLANTLYGGSGTDRFVIAGDHLPDRASDPAAATIIMDLNNSEVIDLSRYHEHGFVLVDHFDGKPNELQLVYDRSSHTTWLEGTTDGDADAEFLIGLHGRHTDFDNFIL